jgi:hypothetical protein
MPNCGAYIEDQINPQIDRQQKEYNNCQGDTDPVDRFDEDNRWFKAADRFQTQLDRAGEAHLALLDAQPFKGAYDSSGVASTGGTRPTSNEASSQARTQSPSSALKAGPKTYAPFTNCVRVTEATQTNQQRITNTCDRAIEAHWEDQKGGHNQVTIPQGQEYRGGYDVRTYTACDANDGFDWKEQRCRD